MIDITDQFNKTVSGVWVATATIEREARLYLKQDGKYPNVTINQRCVSTEDFTFSYGKEVGVFNENLVYGSYPRTLQIISRYQPTSCTISEIED